MSERSALLEVTDLVVSFGGVRAVDGVSFSVAAGEMHGLIGPNGAGKTSTIDALTGFVPHRGRISFEGRTIDDLPAHERSRAGLTRTFQSLELFDDLTVRENCQVGPRRGAPAEDIDRVLDLFDLTPFADRTPPELSLGHRKLVAVARALASRPRLLLLDEPAAGLDSTDSLLLGEHLRSVIDVGVTVLLVDHDMGLVLGVCDHVTVLDFGRVLASGTPDEIRSNSEVIDAYLGAGTAQHAPGAGT
jgi:ABC-type branched-subunit amino acid transport system ATPase component